MGRRRGGSSGGYSSRQTTGSETPERIEQSRLGEVRATTICIWVVRASMSN